MAVFACDLLISRGCKQFLTNTWVVASGGILCTCNDIVATDYLQRCNRNGNFHLIEIIITPLNMSYYMNAYEILRITVKTVWNSDENIKGSQVKYSACWNFCCKPSQAIRTSNHKPIATKLFATSVQGLNYVKYLSLTDRSVGPCGRHLQKDRLR